MIPERDTRQYKPLAGTNTEFNHQRQDWNIGRWLRTRGISLDDLGGHEQIDNVVTLINIRDDLWHRMSPSEQATWGAYWNIVYKKGFPLNKKFWNKFENIVKVIDNREQLKEQKLKAFRDHLKTTKKPGAR